MSWGLVGNRPIRHGEIWYIDLDPTKGHEIKKIRPAVVISADSVGVLAVKLVAPITGWSPRYEGKVWLVSVKKSEQNGLGKDSAIDVLQTRSVALERFTKKVGTLEAPLLEQVKAAMLLVIDYPVP